MPKKPVAWKAELNLSIWDVPSSVRFISVSLQTVCLLIRLHSVNIYSINAFQLSYYSHILMICLKLFFFFEVSASPATHPSRKYRIKTRDFAHIFSYTELWQKKITSFSNHSERLSENLHINRCSINF